MRTTKVLAAGLLTLTLLGACRDDDTPVTAGDDQDGGDATGQAPDGTSVDVPDRAPDLVGTITSVEPFVPVTGDCTPAEDLDPDGAVSNDDPPICTPEHNDVVGTILVEGDLAPERGRKISYTVTSGSTIAGETAAGTTISAFDDLAEGQTVETWVPEDGACAESYPEQCGLEALRVTG